jgi:hypothetical protein
MNRTNLDIPESTVWPARDDAPQAPVASDPSHDASSTHDPEATPGEGSAIELGSGEAGGDDRSSGEQIPSLDPDRDDAERNAAGGGWEGANEQIENDFETEQLRERQERRENA